MDRPGESCASLAGLTRLGAVSPAGGGGGGVVEAGPTVIVANWFEPPRVAESWTTVVNELANVVTGKLALVAPAGTVTFDGTLARPGSWLPRATTVPPVGAAVASVTVPVDGVPPTTLDGLTVNDAMGGGGRGTFTGLTVRSADRVTPPPVTEMVTIVVAETTLGMIRIAPLVLPAGITTADERKGRICE